MDNLIDIVNSAWGWTGRTFVKCLGQNEFGNLILEDLNGQYWRICPEELSIEIVAEDRAGLDQVSRTKEFYEDWNMQGLVSMASEKFGALPEGRKYCLKIPGVLGGKYEIDNISTITLKELIEFSGDVAEQIIDLPDGAEVEFKFVE